MTLLNSFLEEFPNYFGTQDYIRGVLVEMTGITIEVILLSILVPGVLLIHHHFRTRPLRVHAQFYFMRVYNRIAAIFLDLSSFVTFKDILPILLDELEKNPKSKILRHGFTYSLGEKLLVLSRLLSDENAYLKHIQSKRAGDFERYSSICKECDVDIAQLIVLSALPRIQEELFRVQQLLSAIREFMDDSAKRTENEGLDLYTSREIVKMVGVITRIIEKDYREREKLIASVRHFQEFKSLIPLLLKVPYVLARRFFGIAVCRMQKKPYRDIMSASSFPEKLKEWREKHNLTPNELAIEFGISLKEYIAFENGYKQPKGELYVKLCNRIYRKN